MAAPSEPLTAQLDSKLQDENIPLQERLSVAQKVFCASVFSVLQKEEQILAWHLEIVENERTVPADRKLCYKSLLYCFKSERMKKFNSNIRSSVMTKLVQVFRNCPEDCKDTMQKCCVEVASRPYFQRLFMCDAINICKLTRYYLLSITSKESFDDFIAMIDQFLYIFKMSLMKGTFRKNFVKEMLIPLSTVFVYLQEDKTSTFYYKAVTLLKEVLFYEPKYIKHFVDLHTVKTFEPEADIKYFSKQIKHLPTKQDPEIVKICYCLFLKSVISKYPENFELIFRIFTLLTPPLGIIVNQVRSIEMVPVNNWQIDDSFEIIEALVDILDKSKVPLSCQLSEVSLQNWFTGLVIGLSNINNKTFTVNFFRMVTRVLEFNPLVIEPASKVLTMIMLQIKSLEIKPAYVKLIKTVAIGSSRLQRLQKFISFFLQHMSECLAVSCEEDLVLEDVLPKEVADEFSRAVVQLPNTQVLSVMKSFLFHLQRDCLPSVESCVTETSVCINMEVISEMTYQLIVGTNIADHSVPDVVKQKFKLILEEMQVLLKQFGIVFQDIHEDRLLRSYFLLCKAFGAMKLLFREYDNIQIIAPTDIDLEPTNLCYVHNYMHPDNWKKIALMLENHRNCEAKNEFLELLVQKIEAVAQVEEGYEGPGTLVARYLLTLADDSWLCGRLIVLAPLFQSAELSVLVRKIIYHVGEDHSRWLPLLKDDAFSENRRLVLAIGFQLMVMGSEGLCFGIKDSVSYEVLSLIHHSSLLEYELSQMITDDQELKANIEEWLHEMANILNENLHVKPEPAEKVPHISVFEVPARLPLHHFSALNQCCVLLSAVALLYQLPLDCEADLYLFNLILKIMDGPKKNNPLLLGKLNPGILLKFVATRGKNYRGQRKLMNRICFNAFQTRSASKKLFKQVCSPQAEDLWVTAVVIDSLTQWKNKHLGSDKGSRKPLERKKCLEHLLSSVLPLLSSEKPSPANLYAYSVLFKYCIQHSSEAQLMPTLKEYVEFAMASYKAGSLLIEAMIQHRGELEDKYFPKWLMASTWQLMRSELINPQESISHLIFETTTFEEFNEIVPTLLTDTLSEMEKETWDFRMANLLSLWCHLASSLVSSEKSSCREEAIIGLITRLPTLASRWEAGLDCNIIPVVVELLVTVAKNTSISLRPVMMDSYLTMLEVIPLPRNCGETLTLHLTHCLDAMFTLYLFRTSLLIDRLPVLMQLFRMYMEALASVSGPSQSLEVLKSASSVANKIERAATTMIKRKKEFSRLAPYVIANVMNIFQHHNLSSNIKFCYTNVVNAFLSISDKHAVSYLKGVLPLGQQELFNNVYESYNKFNRFVGKI